MPAGSGARRRRHPGDRPVRRVASAEEVRLPGARVQPAIRSCSSAVSPAGPGRSGSASRRAARRSSSQSSSATSTRPDRPERSSSAWDFGGATRSSSTRGSSTYRTPFARNQPRYCGPGQARVVQHRVAGEIELAVPAAREREAGLRQVVGLPVVERRHDVDAVVRARAPCAGRRAPGARSRRGAARVSPSRSRPRRRG